MRKLLSFIFAAVAIVACSQSDIDESAIAGTKTPGSLTVGFEGDETRVHLEAGKTVWSKGDLVSVFYSSAENLKFEFKGEDGERLGTIAPVEALSDEQTMDEVVLVYPYNKDYLYDSEGGVFATLPATQSYKEDSYGVGASLMIASSDLDNFRLKSVCGWLKLNISGSGSRVKSIMVRGNNDEKVAGQIYAEAKSAKAYLNVGTPSYKELTLDCGNGVALSSSTTAFYIALPPQTFTKGFTVVVEDASGVKHTKSLEREVAIKRNTILPMAEFSLSTTGDDDDDDSGSDLGEELLYPANNQIWYTSNNGQSITVTNSPCDDATVVSNKAYGSDIAGLHAITFDKDITSIASMAMLKSNIESLYLPHSVTTIGQSAFIGCTSLLTVHLGKNIESISMGAFTNSSHLKEIYCRATTPPTLGEYVFMADGGTGYVSYVQAKIFVPKSAVEAYKVAPGWSKFADYIRAYDFVAGKEVKDDDPSSVRTDFNHRILIIDHTGVNCGYCPDAADKLHALANYSDKRYDYSSYYNEVTCHGGSFANGDPAYSEAANTVDRFYSSIINGGYPTIAINFKGGKVDHTNKTNQEFVENTMTAMFNKHRKSLGADVGIAISSKIESNNVKVDIEVTAAKDDKYNVAVWVLENNIYSPNQNGATSDIHTTYNHALRAIGGAYSRGDISGDQLAALSVGEKANKSYTIALESGWNKSNLEVLVLVSAANSSGVYEVINTAVCPANGTRDYEYLD